MERLESTIGQIILQNMRIAYTIWNVYILYGT